VPYYRNVPKLWKTTIEAHRREVTDAILDTAARLVAEQGLRAVTMSQIASETGIGRATLYKYFRDAESILSAWHEREIARHLQYLADVRDEAVGPVERLEAMLEAFALMSRQSPHGHHDGDLAALLHRHEQVGHAQRKLHAMIREVIADGASTGDLRNDVAPAELASFCLHALTAAAGLPSKTAVRRLVSVTIDGLRAD
jgi:AcrR family transcriptional regulator